MTRLRNSVLLAAAAILLMTAGCEQNAEAAPEETPVYAVDLTQLELVEFVPTVESFGSLSYRRKTDISPAVDGIVAEVLAEEGDRVRREQVLARIENIQLTVRERQAEADLQSSEAALRLANTRYSEGKLQVESRLLSLDKLQLRIDQKALELEELERTITNKEELLAVNGISQEEFRALKLQAAALETEYASLQKDMEISTIGLRDDDIRAAGLLVPSNPNLRRDILLELNTRTLLAEAEVAAARMETAKAELESVRLLVAELDVRARADGILGARYKEEGERVNTGDPIFTTFQSGEVYAAFGVQEDEAIQLAPGMRTEITVPSLDRRVAGIIDLISPTIDPQTGNVQVKALIDNGDGALKPGMFVRVSVPVGSQVSRWELPQAALVRTRGDRAEVFVVTGNRVFLREIGVGETVSGAVTVTEGLAEDDVIVMSPPPFLREGMHVEDASF